MAKKKITIKKTQSKTKLRKKGLVIYVEDSTPKAKLFYTEKEMDDFVNHFNDQLLDKDAGTWIDMCVTGITGSVLLMDDYDPFNAE